MFSQNIVKALGTYLLYKYLWYVYQIIIRQTKSPWKIQSALIYLYRSPIQKMTSIFYLYFSHTYIHVISKLGNISFYPHKKLLKLNKVHRKGEKKCILSSISTTSCFYVHKKVLEIVEHLSNMYICLLVCTRVRIQAFY